MNTDLTPAPTPRTDAEILTWMTFPETPQMMPPVVTSIFARGLERELLTASKERDSAIEELVEAKQAWLDKSDAERGPYVAFETYDSVCRALREEQLKTQALTEAVNEALKPEYLLSCDLLMSNPPKNASVWCIQAHLRSALAGEQPTRP